MDELTRHAQDRLYAMAFYHQWCEPRGIVRRVRVTQSRHGVAIEVFVTGWAWLLFGALHWWTRQTWQARALGLARRLKTNYGIVRVRTTWAKQKRD